MPFTRWRSLFSVPLVPASLLLVLCACHGGGGSTDNPDTPLSNVDLAVTNFTVSPAAADSEDLLTLSGTLQNLGTETANPNPGDQFLIAFNLSQDGTFELREQGFLQKAITDPIPPGESLDFSYTGPYGGGETLSHYGDFCSGDFGGECVPPETGVIGVKADFANDIGERNEGDNFDFKTIDVVGTRVGVTSSLCDFGTLAGPDGCDLRLFDGFTQFTQHRPSSDPAYQVVFPNELQRIVYVSLTIVNCLAALVPNGSCGGSATIVGTTQKPGLEASIQTLVLECRAVYKGDGSTGASCSTAFEIRDPNY